MPAASSSLCFYFIFLVGSSTSFSIFVFLFSFPSASPLIPSGILAKTHIEADSEVFFILSFSRLFDSIFSFSFVRSFFFLSLYRRLIPSATPADTHFHAASRFFNSLFCSILFHYSAFIVRYSLFFLPSVADLTQFAASANIVAFLLSSVVAVECFIGLIFRILYSNFSYFF